MRIKSEDNLEYIRRRPCMVCGAPPPSDPDHLRSRGAGGGDELSNLLALCRKHHVERHRSGIKTFVEKYKLRVSFDGFPKRTDVE